jgi:hypothetical protein
VVRSALRHGRGCTGLNLDSRREEEKETFKKGNI